MDVKCFITMLLHPSYFRLYSLYFGCIRDNSVKCFNVNDWFVAIVIFRLYSLYFRIIFWYMGCVKSSQGQFGWFWVRKHVRLVIIKFWNVYYLHWIYWWFYFSSITKKSSNVYSNLSCEFIEKPVLWIANCDSVLLDHVTWSLKGRQDSCQFESVSIFGWAPLPSPCVLCTFKTINVWGCFLLSILN